MERRGLSPHDPERGSAPSHLDPPADALTRRLFPSLATEVEWGLDRTRAALADLGDPHRTFASIHVGGTNGKGSVAAACASVLRADGRRVGLYTSPHLVSFTERYRIDGEPASEERLSEVAAGVRGAVEGHGLTFFEAATVLAFELFRREELEIAVVEVGLGGRLDATNVLRPEVTAVTNVALDHVQHLGRSLEGIAREKAGIVKEGVPLVTSEAKAELVRVLREAAHREGAPFHRVERSDLRALRAGPEGSRFRFEAPPWGVLSLRCPLPGAHQALNAALAVRILGLLRDVLRPEREAVRRGIASLRWPGRIQLTRIRGSTWVFDVAHNAAAARSLVEALPALDLPSPVVIVAGLLADKDPEAILPPLAAEADVVVLTVPSTAPPGRRWDPERGRAALGPGVRVEVVPELERALETAGRLAGSGSVIVTGSHHTVGGALRTLEAP